MFDLVVGIVVLVFIALGLWQGLVKTLASVVAIFAALFAASSTLGFLAGGAPQFNDPNNLGALVLFILISTLCYILLDLFLLLLFRKIITITVLGALDRVGGFIAGWLRGMLICGVVLQLALYFPFPESYRRRVTNSPLARFSIALFHWTAPLAERFMPISGEWMKQSPVGELKGEDVLKETGEAARKALPEKYEDIKKTQEQKIKELLKDQKLLHGAPVKKVGDALK
jgi:uncharacterized membrane protein required for colicin V production